MFLSAALLDAELAGGGGGVETEGKGMEGLEATYLGNGNWWK